ncbi:MAG: HxsD-like protein [Parcubacteria group bacterium]
MVKLNRKIYVREAIEQAIKDYKGLAGFRLSEKGKYYLISIKPKENGTQDVIEREFCNYILSLEKGM